MSRFDIAINKPATTEPDPDPDPDPDPQEIYNILRKRGFSDVVSNLQSNGRQTEVVSMQERIPMESFILNPGTRDREQLVDQAERRLLNALLTRLLPYVAMAVHDDAATHERVVTATIEILKPKL